MTTDASVVAGLKALKAVKSCLDNPLEFFLQTEGPDQDSTWVQSLPNEALRLAMRHCMEVSQGYYKPEIGGALSQPKGQRYNVEQFHKGARVSKRFFEPFQIAYDPLVGSREGRSEEKLKGNAAAAATASDDTGIGEAMASEDKKNTKPEPDQLMAFRKLCESSCQTEIDGRVVLLVAQGGDVEIRADVTASRMYQNFTHDADVMVSTM